MHTLALARSDRRGVHSVSKMAATLGCETMSSNTDGLEYKGDTRTHAQGTDP